MTTRHIDRAITKLKRDVLALGSLVEESLYRAVKAVGERNPRLAEEVFESDREIDDREVEIEEECLKVLALNQPTGNDLRLIIAVMKMTNDLERIGDLAVSIGWKAHTLSFIQAVDLPPNLEEMGIKTKLMLRSSLEALVNLDVKAAREVLSSDDEIDVMNRENFSLIIDRIQQNPSQSEALINLLSVSRNLERIADHATNIAEDVIYMVDGEIVRHGGKQRERREGERQ